VRACTPHLSWLIGGGACEHAACAESIGIAAVLVQAKDAAARGFYLRQAEFMTLPKDGKVLRLSAETVVGAIDEK
jgi:hypothetical protein